jgi:hypothetical protein
MFDMEYARWLEEDQRHLAEIRAALQAALPDNELRVIVDGYLYHYDELFRLKGVAVKSDVFHLIKGIWASPAERPFIWIGGFKPSELITVILSIFLSSSLVTKNSTSKVNKSSVRIRIPIPAYIMLYVLVPIELSLRGHQGRSSFRAGEGRGPPQNFRF